MTPMQLARNLAESEKPEDRALGVAMALRGLTDPDPSDPLKQPWPVNEFTAAAAARYVGITDPSPDLLAHAITLAPTVSDAMLNRHG